MQGLIFQLLKTRFSSGIEAIRYWRTQNQAEVDFVLQNGLDILPIEVKAERMKKPQVERSLHNFIATYKPAEAWIVNRNLKESIQIEDTEVKFIPWFDLLV